MQVASVANQDAHRLVVVATLMTNAAMSDVIKFVNHVNHQYQIVQDAYQIVQAAVVMCVSVASMNTAEITIASYKYCIRIDNFSDQLNPQTVTNFSISIPFLMQKKIHFVDDSKHCETIL